MVEPGRERERRERVERKTKETSIAVELAIDTAGVVNIASPVAFFNHMLEAMAFHGGFSLQVAATGDTEVDDHHLVEDTGIVFGQCLQLIRERQPVVRFGNALVPMDDALAEVAIDAGGRGYCHFDATFPQARVGTFDVSLVREFVVACAVHARLNLHAIVRHGVNSHHMIEALYKALGRALFSAYQPAETVRSTKGMAE